jgi:hypothetical protein
MDRLGGGSCTGRTNDGNRRLYPLKCQCEVVISGTYFEFGDSIHAVLVVLWSQVSMRRQFLRVRPCALADNGYNIPRSYAPWLYRIITSECMFECLLFCRRVPLIETCFTEISMLSLIGSDSGCKWLVTSYNSVLSTTVTGLLAA